MSRYEINSIEKVPKLKEKAKPKSNLSTLIDRFESENMQIAEILIPEGKAHGILIGIGRVLANKKKNDKEYREHIRYSERLDGKAVILERINLNPKAKTSEKKT